MKVTLIHPYNGATELIADLVELYPSVLTVLKTRPDGTKDRIHIPYSNVIAIDDTQENKE